MKVSIVIPCFNEEDSIGDVLVRVKDIEVGCEKEIIVVNDGSTDKSDEICRAFCGVRLIEHERNMGKGAAVQTGIGASTGDIVLVQDADMEYLPEDIPRLVQPILDGRADVVLGSRFLGENIGMSRSHKLGNRVLSVTTGLFYWRKITDVMTGYKAVRRELLNDISLSSKDFSIETELIAKILSKNVRFMEVPISYRYRLTGKSKIYFRHGFRSLWTLLKLRSMQLGFRPSMLVLLLCVLYIFGVLATRNFDPTSFIYIGRSFLDRDSAGPVASLVRQIGFGPPYWDVGYDGQMYYYLALNPLDAWRILDTVARYERIVYPLLSRVFTFGFVSLTPYSMIVVNVGAITVGTEVVDRMLRSRALSPWYSLVYGLYVGQLLSLRHDTPEPLTYMFVLLAVYAYERKHSTGVSGFLFALALFTKETAVFFVGAYALALFLEKRGLRDITKFWGIALLPYGVYQLFLFGVFGILPIVTVGVAGYFSLIPFYGVMTTGHDLSELLNLAFLIVIPSILACLLFVKGLFSRDFRPLALALLLNGVFMIFLPAPSYASLQDYGRISLGLVTSFMLYSIWSRKTQMLKYSLVWMLPLATYFTTL